MGNICIKPTHPNHALDISPTLNTTMQPHDLRPSNFGYSGLRTTIIDYTLSRATSSSSDNTNNNHPTILYDPMKALSIFTQTGKTPEQTSQFSTYRKMRAHALASDAQSRNEDPSRENKKRDKWERFLPRTNVLWLECLLFTLLYRSRERVLVGSSEVAGGVQEGIYKGLKRMMGILGGGDSGEREEGPGSARQVIEVAHGEGLLTDQDLVAIKESLE
jgi:Haspin like kinase domain